jgi:AraC-like DNA-binding protein
MQQVIEALNRIEYIRLSPSALLGLFRSGTGAITKYQNFKRLTINQAHSSIVGDYRKISEGFWCMRFEYLFSKETEVCFTKGLGDSFYELEYFFIPQNHGAGIHSRQKLPFDSQAVFSSSAYQKTWRINEGSTFSSYKFVFTKEFIEENFCTEDISLQDLVIQKLMNTQQPYFNRDMYKEESFLLKELDRIFTSEQAKLIQAISIKAKVLELFCKFFELQAEPFDHYESDSAFANAIALMKQNIEETFPGLADLAKVSNVSIPTFKRRFKNLFSHTPEKYFRHLQMDEAERQLRKGTMNIKEVAAYLGYVNPKNFTECFKKVKGYLPSDVKN